MGAEAGLENPKIYTPPAENHDFLFAAPLFSAPRRTCAERANLFGFLISNFGFPPAGVHPCFFLPPL
jgi:hypothetical protein